MAHPFGWERYVGDKGDILGINTFGASAPGDRVIAEYGFTVENVVSRVKACCNPSGSNSILIFRHPHHAGAVHILSHNDVGGGEFVDVTI